MECQGALDVLRTLRVALGSAFPEPPETGFGIASKAVCPGHVINGHGIFRRGIAKPGGCDHVRRAGANVQWGKELLSEWWGVTSRDQLLEMLEWLQFQGHRAAFEQLGRQVDAMNEKECKAAEAALLEDPEQLFRAQIVRQYHHTLGIFGRNNRVKKAALDIMRFSSALFTIRVARGT